jgi:hypothetical protein
MVWVDLPMNRFEDGVCYVFGDRGRREGVGGMFEIDFFYFCRRLFFEKRF